MHSCEVVNLELKSKTIALSAYVLKHCFFRGDNANTPTDAFQEISPTYRIQTSLNSGLQL